MEVSLLFGDGAFLGRTEAHLVCDDLGEGEKGEGIV